MGGSAREMKRIVIVGASSGLGLEVAKLLLAEGHSLGVAARREDRLMALKQEAPDRVDVATIDVTAADAGTRPAWSAAPGGAGAPRRSAWPGTGGRWTTAGGC